MAGSYNPINNSDQYTGATDNKGFFSKMLRNLSSFGVDLETLRNQVGVGINEDPYAASSGDPMFDMFAQKAMAKVLQQKSIPYLNKSYIDKRKILMEYSIKDEIRVYLERICDEAIVYTDSQKFCSPKALPTKYSKEVHDKYNEFFESIYNMYGFADGISAWNKMKKLLVEGYLSYEIVWDDKKQYIVSFNEIPSWTIAPTYEPALNTLMWIQYPEDPQIRRIFLDSQLIHISYSSHEEFMETSYVEGLIKPYNQLKILEQTKIMFNVVNASLHQTFKVPVEGMSRPKAEEQISHMISQYQDHVEWDDGLGILTINGSKQLNFYKQMWFPSTTNGSVEMDIVAPQGHNLNDDDMLTYFSNNLKRASRIPLIRLDSTSGGGVVYNDVGSITADEATFGKFLDRLRVLFKDLIVKPLRLMMCMEYPELLEDDLFMNSVNINYNTDQMFEKAKKIANIKTMSQTVEELMRLKDQQNKPYFSIHYLIEKFFETLTPEEIEENKIYKKKYGTGGGGEDGGGYSDDGGSGGGPDLGGPDYGGGDEFMTASQAQPEPQSNSDEGGGEAATEEGPETAPDTGSIDMEF